MTLSNNHTAQRRDKNLDFCKGVAIFMVVLGHVLLFVMKDLPSLCRFIYTFHMPFFFMLSGYMAWRAREFGLEFWLKKARQLLLPMLVVGSVFAVTYEQMYDFLTGSFHAGYWYLSMLFEIWVVFALVRMVVLRLRIRHILYESFVLFLPFLGLKILSNYYPDVPGNVLSLDRLPAYYVWFVVGYLLGNVRKITELVKHESVQAVAMAIFVFVAISFLKDAPYIDFLPVKLLQLVLCLSCFVCCCCANGAMRNKLASYVQSGVILGGGKSLQIYIFHYFIIRIFSMDITSVSVGFRFLMAVGLSLIIIIFSLAIGQAVEHNKYLAFLCLGKKDISKA